MPIPVMCPECGAKMILPESALGQRKKCPECGDPFTIRSVNDTERDDAPANTRPLDPGWKKVVLGYRMLNFALFILLIGVFVTAGTTVGAWALYVQKQVFQDDTIPRVVGWVVGGVFGTATAVFVFLGHLFFLAMPENKDGGKGKTLTIVMFAVLFFPLVNATVPLLLLPVFSAGVGTALGSRRLTNSGWNLYTWYAAGAFVVPMLANGFLFGGQAVGSQPLGFIGAGVVLFVGWSLTIFVIYKTFDGLRWDIEEAIRERGLRG